MHKYECSRASIAITRQHDINAFPSALENQRQIHKRLNLKCSKIARGLSEDIQIEENTISTPFGDKTG